MKSLAELQAIRDKVKTQLNIRKDHENEIKIFVGMGTCGIAAGAKSVLNAFVEELAKRNITNVKVMQTDCMGDCRCEPVVDVITQDGNKAHYVKMTPKKAVKVVEDHIVNNKIVAEYTIDENK